MLELIFTKLLEISIQASFFILAVVLIRFCFKRLPKRYVCVLWALVVVRLILPFEITSPVSLVPDTSETLTWTNAELTIPFTPEIPERFPSQQLDPVPQNHLTQENPAPETNVRIPEKASTTKTLTLSGLFCVIWLLGVLVFLTYDLVSYLRLKLRLRAAIHSQDNIWYCDRIPSPFVLGFVKPRIYVPFSVHKEQLPYIIAHERAHISHLDHLTKLLAALLLGVYWFNPFIWIAYLLYCRDLELACDERVIAKLGISEKKPYSEALLICSVTNKALLQSPLSFSEVAIKDRIVNILNYKKPGFWGVVLAAVVCVIAGACFLTSSEPDDSENTTETSTLTEKTDTPISSEASDFIRQTTPDMLDKVTKTNYLGNVMTELPAAVEPDAYYRILSHGNLTLQLYALVNNEALIIRDGDTLYPLYDLQDLTIDTQELAVYKSDYDSDGTPEFALYKSAGHGSGYGIMGITMLEMVDGVLQATPFTISDMRAQLDRISYRYEETEENIYVSVDSGETEIALDVSWLNFLYGYPFPRLHWGDQIDFEERDGQWWIIAQSGVLPDPGVSALYTCGAIFTAPVTYHADHTFQLGDISVELYAEKDTTTEEVYLDTSWYYMRGAQFLKDIDWEAFSTRISEDENLTLQQFMPILTDKEFVWIYRLADNTHAKKQTTIRKLLADQYDMHGINQVEPNIYTFCFADLFQTGNNDLILCLCNLPGWEWLIFHEEDGVVYCMDMSIRWFSYPQTNGIYTASNGADDTSYYRLIFADGDILEEQIGRVIGDELYIDDVKQSSSAYEAWKKENLTTEYYPYYHPIEETPSTD